MAGITVFRRIVRDGLFCAASADWGEVDFNFAAREAEANAVGFGLRQEEFEATIAERIRRLEANCLAELEAEQEAADRAQQEAEREVGRLMDFIAWL